MKLAILMDPPHGLKAYKDSTVAMIESAMAMGWSCVYFTSVYCRDGQPYAEMSAIQVRDYQAVNWADITPLGDLPLTDFDVILMRKEPPFNLDYIYATYALELAERAGVLVANKPQSLRDANEKFFTLHFPECCPTTLVSSDISRLLAFWKEQGSVIFKPLDGMGGQSIFHVDEKGQNLSVILETITHNEREMIMAQRYIPAIRLMGDKRILLIDGEPVQQALARIPAEGELRGNLAAGAVGKVVPLTERDRFICSQLGPTLRSKGLYFVGIDVIGDYLTEINVTCPTCIREISQETGLDIAGDYLRCLALKLSHTI